MTRPCPSCRTNGADDDDPQGLCAECAADQCNNCEPGDQCPACGDDRHHDAARDERAAQISHTRENDK